MEYKLQSTMDIRHLERIAHFKKLKKNGSLDEEQNLNNQKFKWRNTIHYTILKEFLTCSNEEIRLNVLELIAISKKSTLTFTKQELDLIIEFLKHNLREKTQHVPLIKKILKRLNGSYAILKRNLEKEKKLKVLKNLHPNCPIPIKNSSNTQKDIHCYEMFVRSLHLICIDNIYTGAVNIRKKSSLQILNLKEEFLNEDLKSSLWNLCDFEKLFNCLLLDTYELNKEAAYNLIKSCNLIESFFDSDEKLLELVKVAIEMGNSIRPLDSITAAYMLKISMLLPNIQKILLQLINFEETDEIEEKTTFYMIMLLKCNLEKPVQLASENIVIASSKHSLYGYIFCIHSILSTINLRSIVNDKHWKNILSDIINMCLTLNTAVSQIVNNSSPEGHLPMDLNPRHLDPILHDAEEIVITPQMVLLCSWRTVKEVSLLYGHLTSNASIFSEKTNSGLLSENQIKEIGNQLVTLLCETKHRGAFEQAHVGFGQLCSRLWHLDEDQAKLRQLPKIWLQQLLLAVIGFASDNSKLCATRRSAGVPFMVQALVTSEIKKRADPKTLIFHSVMRILLKLTNLPDDFNLNDVENIIFNEILFTDYIRKEKNEVKLNEITEIKTHSLNILRALYRHCLLGELVKDYIAEGFITAFRSYDGKSWAERNAGTLLFSALVTRVFGVQRTKDHVNLTLHNRMTGKMFFEKFPNLLPFLLSELTIFVNETEDQIKPKIQSILLILSRLYPGVTAEVADEDWKIDQFIDLVSKCGKSKVYKTRELAARALVPLLTEKNVLIISDNIISLMTGCNLPVNLLHGFSLQLLEIVKSQQFSKMEPLPEKFQEYFSFMNEIILHNLESSQNGLVSFPVATTALEVFNEISKLNSFSWIYKESTFLELLDKIQLHLTDNKILKKRPGRELYEVAVMNLIISTLDNANYTGPLVADEYKGTHFWENILKHNNVDVLTVAWKNLIHTVEKSNSALLYDLGFMNAIKFIEKPLEDPDLQDAVFEFTYYAIIKIEKNKEYIQYTFSNKEEKIYLCKHIFAKLSQHLTIKSFYLRGEFFKLFGKACGFLLKNQKTSVLSQESKKVIYDAFSTYSNMESNLDCRLGISEVLIDLYIDITVCNDIYFILEWWTTLLQLLYDDNVQIRLNAAEVVSELIPRTGLQCEAITIEEFFDKFTSIIGQNTEAATAAFFCWSMNSAAVVLEEMDETDVFNKSCNYECFEPLQITNYCIQYLRDIIPKNTSILSNPIKSWLRKQLDLSDSFNFESITDLILQYKSMIPDTTNSLERILDPTYPAKLIKEVAYHKFRDTVINKKRSPRKLAPARGESK